jgi:hypothetical protein
MQRAGANIAVHEELLNQRCRRWSMTDKIDVETNGPVGLTLFDLHTIADEMPTDVARPVLRWIYLTLKQANASTHVFLCTNLHDNGAPYKQSCFT